MDATGFSTCRFERWYDHKWGKVKSKREWMKLHAMTGVRTNIVTAVEVTSSESTTRPASSRLSDDGRELPGG